MDSTYRCQSRMRRNSFTTITTHMTITTHITSAIPGSARSRPKVVRAVDVAGITLVGVIARVTSEIEGIVPPVADHFHQRLSILVEDLGKKGGKRIVLTHQRARRSDVERML